MMETQTPSKGTQHPVIAQIKSKMGERDLPVLRKTVGRIVALASSAETGVGDLAQTILQDQSFSTRVLAVANGVFYRNRQGSVTTVPRAIVQVGYNTVRDIAVAAEFVDMAQQRLPYGVNLQTLLAQALVAAHQAKVVGEAIRIKNCEDLFTMAQFQNLGAFALAFYLPMKLQKIQEMVTSHGFSYQEAHEQVLQLTPDELTMGIMDLCRLPKEMMPSPVAWDASDGWT